MDDKVKECVHHSNKYKSCDISSKNCGSNPNCYFKQNLALKKENEELQEKIISYENEFERIANIDNNNVSILEEKLKIAVEALEEIENYESNNGYFYQTAVNIAQQALTQIGESEEK